MRSRCVFHVLSAGVILLLGTGTATALTGAAESPADTLDSQAPQIVLIQPVGGEIWRSGDEEVLRWTIQEPSLRDAPPPIYIRIYDGETALLIDTVLPDPTGDYSYAWTVAEAHTTEADFRVDCTDRFGWTSAVVGAPFQILGSLSDTPQAVFRDGFAGAAPNPFNPSTEIRFSLGAPAAVELSIFDLRGREVTKLAGGRHEAGDHTVAWHGRDAGGNVMPSGTYLARLTVDGDDRARQFTTRLTLVK